MMNNSLENNFCIKADSYKATQWAQHPEGTARTESYLESRGSNNPLLTETTVFGFQYILMKHLVGEIITMEKIDQAEVFWNLHFGPGTDGKPIKNTFNRKGWETIVKDYGGKLPLRIKAVPEGTTVPLSNVLATVTTTVDDERIAWVTDFVETIFLQVWYPITIASNSRTIKKIIYKYLNETTEDEIIPFILPSRLHDFGFRGVSSYETAGIGGMSHLVNFTGTDTVPGIILAMNYYNADMCGSSVPASQHSTVTSWLKEFEKDAIKNMLDKYSNAPFVSIVSDSYDIYNAVSNIYGVVLKDLIRERAGVTVIRPDSGDPVTVLRKIFYILWDKFGGTTNSKGYKVLDPKIRVIQGDGIELNTVVDILQMLKDEGFSTENLVLGSGGGLLQKFDRDTFKFAVKCNSAYINGEERDVYKDPITSKGKRSKSGRLKLVKDENGNYYTASSKKDDNFEELKDEMVTIFENGEMVTTYTFDEIRERAKI